MAEIRADTLDEIPKDFVLTFCETVLATELPLSIYPYSFTKNSFDWRRKDRTYDVAFYFNKENIESGIFVGIVRTGKITFCLIVYAHDGYEDLLKHSLLNTNKIMWQELPIVQGILPRHMKLVEDVIKQQGLKFEIFSDSTIQLLPIETALNYRIELPDDVYMDTLTDEHIDLIFSLCPSKINTKNYLNYSISLGRSVGIFSKSSKQLLAWAIQSHFGAVGMLHTTESCRRRGLGKIVVMSMSKMLAEGSFQPFGAVRESNINSLKLFRSVGYKQITLIKYLQVVKCE